MSALNAPQPPPASDDAGPEVWPALQRFFRKLFNSIVSKYVICEKAAHGKER